MSQWLTNDLNEVDSDPGLLSDLDALKRSDFYGHAAPQKALPDVLALPSKGSCLELAPNEYKKSTYVTYDQNELASVYDYSSRFVKSDLFST